MMMSLSCGTIILAAVVAASVSLQRTFAAVESYSGTEGDQVRVLDYIAMDSRRAFSATVTNGQLQFTLPAYYNSSSSPAYQAYAPTISSGKIAYGSGQVLVTYAQNGSNFTREVQVQDASSNVLSDHTTIIARNVSTFTVTPINQPNPWSTVTCSIMFFPTFIHNTGYGTWRSGPTIPADTVGVDGDWYVIDPTATTPSTIGNVYFRSGGHYSLIQNVKATTVYCNTFLRNANARQSS
jgi:hypothetical protein